MDEQEATEDAENDGLEMGKRNRCLHRERRCMIADVHETTQWKCESAAHWNPLDGGGRDPPLREFNQVFLRIRFDELRAAS